MVFTSFRSSEVSFSIYCPKLFEKYDRFFFFFFFFFLPKVSFSIYCQKLYEKCDATFVVCTVGQKSFVSVFSAFCSSKLSFSICCPKLFEMCDSFFSFFFAVCMVEQKKFCRNFQCISFIGTLIFDILSETFRKVFFCPFVYSLEYSDEIYSFLK